MNRFDQAGFRALRTELVRKGLSQYLVARTSVPKDAQEGSRYYLNHYVCTVLEDPDDKGEAAVEMFLDPLECALHHT